MAWAVLHLLLPPPPYRTLTFSLLGFASGLPDDSREAGLWRKNGFN